jgi:hypothetical protein
VPIAWVQLALVVALLAVISLLKTVDPDFWWHLRTGRLIVESGIPRHDPFSWTAAGKAWVTHEWLSEVFIYGLESTLGYLGNAVFFGVVAGAALLVMYALGRRLGSGTKPLVVLMFPAIFVMVRFVAVRPQEFTWLLFAVFVYVLQRREEGDAMPLWVLPPLMALWVNLHLGFVYGLMAVAVWTLVQAVRWLRTRAVDLRTPLLVAGACLLATFANPNGPAILWYPVRYLFEGRADRSLIMEWQRPDFSQLINIPIALTLVLLAFSLPWQRRRPFLALLSLVAIAFSLQAVRNVPFAVLLLIPVTASATADYWPAASRRGDSRTMFRTIPGVGLVGALAACMLVVAPSFGASVSGFSPSGDGYPADGASFVESHYPGARLFNEYAWGGYLIDRLYPNTRVFIDGRADVYGGGILGDYVRVLKADGWDALLSQYGVDVVLVERDSKLAREMRFSPAWQEAFTGPVEAVFVRR